MPRTRRSTFAIRDIDFFGLGTGEVLVVLLAVVVLYGPERFKRQVGQEEEDEEISRLSVVEKERLERMEKMKATAKKARLERALKRINKAIDEEDPTILENISDMQNS
eukprot:CAMPEP_0182421564 /NCGR_PEP_ID=MMETSP1167-20130531/6978_1 /TAXON_ID=2988 /ORGANISM="Mallomonas Sp, Strain CCMP3275" /LENGTH=107 /DNA_ID=CAMNT_0024598813 /DNA_START=256 /DNA_END=579 /DNA_ORIENTATION=-